MRRLFMLVVTIVAAGALTLVIAPLALGTTNHNKPTVGVCPNDQYSLVSDSADPTGGTATDTNGDGMICEKTVGASGKPSEGPQFIDNTAHNQNG